ncbi:MAG: C10 family peptidase, partial [Bacteroidales bacterium]|nr:C10 family peptidase [Bacteroidales bacterium]
MKTKLFLLILLCSTSVFARQIDVYTAEKVAMHFYYERINQFSKTNLSDIQIQEIFTEKSTDGTILFYAFNISGNGFIVVSAFDNVVPVLCYSFESKYPAENPPDNFMFWINSYKKQIVYAQEKNLLPDDKIIKDWENLTSGSLNIAKDRAVSPLLVSKWNQGTYYNHLCPADAGGPNGHTYAGCVATAMGQIMYYHRWPLTGTGTYSFTDPTYGLISADFANSNYDWDAMQNQLSTYNDTVAKLLFHIGVSCDMHYGPSGSGMTNHKAAYAYRTYFKFCPQTQYVFKDSTTMNWDSILTTNLDAKKPLYYAGWDPVTPTSGHAFVCDGYQGTNYYHFNMGWSGTSDG